MRTDRRLPLRVALPLLFLVGVGALTIETTWIRWFRSMMGATAPAISAALTALALGQLIGTLIGARAARMSARPLRTFGVAQTIAVLLAFLVEPALTAGAAHADGVTARFALALGATLPTSAAIGAAFPLLVASTAERVDDLGPRGVALYAADLIGAAAGAALTVFWLPSVLGVREAHAAGAGVLLIAAVAGVVVSGRLATKQPAERPAVEPSAWPAPETALIAFGSGFGVFAAQLLLHQAFGRVLDQSTFAVGAVLTTTLVALGAGAIAVAALQKRLRPPVLLAGSASLAAFAFAGFPSVFVAATDGLSMVVTNRDAATYVPRAALLCAMTAGPALVTAAAVLPSLFVRASAEAEGDGRVAGHLAGGLLAANTGGAVIGASITPHLLLPTVGLWTSFLVIAVVYASLGVVAVRPRRYAFAVAITLVAVCGIAQPWRYPALKLSEGDELVETTQSAAGLVAVIRRGDDLLMQTDNHYVLGGTADSRHQERQGHLPLLLHPNPRRVAFIGSATGSSAGVAYEHGVEELFAIEIMPGVTDAARRLFGEWNASVYADPRTHVATDDARSFLRRSNDSFDVIVADLFVPWRSETGSLYTVEHFERTKARLGPGGLFCQWLPLYQLGELELESILVTFLHAFPNAEVFRGDFYGAHGIIALVGSSSGELAPVLAAKRTSRLRDQGNQDRWMTHPLGLWALYVGPLEALEKRLGKVPLNTENAPFVEFASARNTARHAGSTDWTAAGDVFMSFSQKLLRGTRWRRGPGGLRERRAATGGYMLQAASTLFVDGNQRAASRALSQAVRLLPPELLSKAPADPTASDVWPD